MYKPGCDEHLILHNLRKANCYLPELDVIATDGSELAGHAICTAATVKGGDKETEVLCFGPFSVHTEMQCKGIGSKLMAHLITRAAELGYPAIIVFGDPKYYQRFGFKNAEQYKITTRDGQNFDPFMVRVLDEGKMKNIQGAFYEADAFTVDRDELEQFEKKFPHKEKGEAKVKI